MATKSMGYDNPAYLAVHQDNLGATTAGANTPTTLKCAAFTSALVKSATLRIGVAGTSANVPNFLQLSGTTTTTTALGTVGSAAVGFVNFALATAAVLAQGDQYWVQNGTDATGVFSAVSLERVVQPLANVTV